MQFKNGHMKGFYIEYDDKEQVVFDGQFDEEIGKDGQEVELFKDANFIYHAEMPIENFAP